MYFAIRELEKEIKKSEQVCKSVVEAANAIGKRAFELVSAGITDLDKAPDDWVCVGFQVVGYDANAAKTIEVLVGKQIKIVANEGLGCTRSGQGHVVDALWQLYSVRPGDQAEYPSFSLQDAIEYAEFLIGTTSSYQRFSRNIPQVGGETDIALITPFDHFKWIKQKRLSEILGG